MNSIEGRLNILKQNLRDVVDNLVSSDMFKGFVDGASGVTEVILNIIKSLNDLNMSAPVAFASLFALMKTIKTLGTGGGMVGIVGSGLFKGGWSQFGKDIATVAKSSDKLSTKVRLLGTSFTGLSMGTGLANIAMTALNGVIMTGVVVALGFAVKKVYEWVNANKIAKQEAEASLKAHQQQTEVYRQQKDDLEKLSKEYDTLSKKKQRTEADDERLLEITNQLADKYPELVSGFDENGVAIIDLANLDNAMSKMDELIAKQERLERQDKIDLGNASRKENADRYDKQQIALREKNKNISRTELERAQELLKVEKELNNVYKSDNIEERRKALNSLQKEYEKNARTLENNYAKSQDDYNKYLDNLSKDQDGIYSTIASRNEKMSEEQKNLTKEILSGLDFSKFDENSISSLTNLIGKGITDGSFESGGSLRFLKEISKANRELQNTGNPFEYLKSIEPYIPKMAELLGVTEDVARQQLAPDNFFYQVANEMDAYMRTFGKTIGNTDTNAKKLKQSYEEIAKAKDILSNSANLDTLENGQVVLNQQVVREFIEDPNVNQKLKNLMQEFNSDGEVTAQEIDVMTKINTKMEQGKESIDRKNFLDIQKDLQSVFGDNRFTVDMFVDPQYIMSDLGNALGEVDKLTELDVEAKANIKIAIAEGDLGAIEAELNSLDTEKQVQVIADISQYMVAMGLLKQEDVSDKVVSIVAHDLASGKISEIQAIEILEKYAKVLGIDEGATALIERVQNATGKEIKLTATGVDQGAKSLANTVANAKSKTITLTLKASGLNGATYRMYKDMGVLSLPVLPEGEPISTFSDEVNAINDGIMAETLGTQHLASGVELSPRFTPNINSRKKTTSTPISNDFANAIKYDVEILKELENRIKMVTNQLSYLDKAMKNATGEEKVKYLKEQVDLYTDQKNIILEQVDALKKQQTYYKKVLQDKGFKFTDDGNFTNYEEKLIAMEKEIASLEEKANKEKASDSDKKKYDDAKKNLDEIKKYLTEYTKVAFDELPKVSEEFLDISNAIQDNLDKIKEFEDEIIKLREDSKYKDNNRDIDDVQNKLDKNEILLENALGERQVELLEERLELLKQLQKETQDLLAFEDERKLGLMGELGQYGFEFRDDGSIEGYGQKIEELKKSLTEKEFEEVFGKIEEYLDTTYSKIPELENKWEDLNNTILDSRLDLEYAQVEQVDKEIERADEEELVGLLEKKLGLLEELANKKKEYVDLLEQEKTDTQNTLSSNGINFDESGKMVNLQEKIKELEDALDKTENLKEKDKLRKKIEDITKASAKYVTLTKQTLPQAVEEWLEAQNQIKDTKDELEDIEKQQAKFLEDRAEAVKRATEDIMKVTQDLLQTQININKKQVEMLEKSMKLSNFDPKQSFETMEKQIALLEQQLSLQNQMGAELEKQKTYYQDQLVKVGIQFDDKGIAQNAESILGKIRDQMANATDAEELEKLEKKFNDIVEALGNYNGALESIVDNQGNLMDIQLEIQGVYENMLQTTKKVEDKITQILTKQVEERKKLIDEELKKRLDSLKKEKDAYNKSREEDKYAEQYEEKLNEIMELQAKIDAVSKDTSLAGKAKLAELLKELADKQKEFDDMVQDKLDKDINDKFDEESDRLQEEADKAKDELDKTLEKEELADAIKDALNTGTIKDIDGNIIDLKDAIFEYEDKYGDGLSVIGGLIKKDLLGQLDISLDTMKNIEKILKTLNIEDLSKSMTFSAPRFSHEIARASSSPTINFNESLITVQGNVDNSVLPKLQDMIKQAERQITRNIIESM